MNIDEKDMVIDYLKNDAEHNSIRRKYEPWERFDTYQFLF
jgi:hypothetical protein